MRDNSHDAGDMFAVAGVIDPVFLGTEAKRMATELVEAEAAFRNEKLEAIAFRLQTKYRVSAGIIVQCVSRPPREMLVSRWMAVFHAHCRWLSSSAGQAYEARRGAVGHQRHPTLLRLADVVAGSNRGDPRAGGESPEGP